MNLSLLGKTSKVNAVIENCRLFSCGTSKDGESHIVEWNENEGHVKRTYLGLNKRSLGIVQFDSTKNRFLAVGDEYTIKVWDMDNPNLLTTIDAEGGLPVSYFMDVCKFYILFLLFVLVAVPLLSQ